MAIKRVFTCASCDSEFSIDNSVYLVLQPAGVWNQPKEGPHVCEGCYSDGVLDDINCNGDIGTVNTSGVF